MQILKEMESNNDDDRESFRVVSLFLFSLAHPKNVWWRQKNLLEFYFISSPLLLQHFFLSINHQWSDCKNLRHQTDWPSITTVRHDDKSNTKEIIKYKGAHCGNHTKKEKEKTLGNKYCERKWKKKCTLNSCQYDLTGLWQEVALESRWFGAYGSSSQSVKMVSQSSFTNPMWTIQEAPFFGSYELQKCVQPCPQPAQKKHTLEAKPPVTAHLNHFLLFFCPSKLEHQSWATAAAVCIQSSAAAAAAAEDKELSMEQKTRMGARSNLQVEEDRNFSLLHFATNDIQATDRSCSIQALPCCRTKTKTPELWKTAKTPNVQQQQQSSKMHACHHWHNNSDWRRTSWSELSDTCCCLMLLDTCCCTKRLTRLSKRWGRSIIIIITSNIIPEDVGATWSDPWNLQREWSSKARNCSTLELLSATNYNCVRSSRSCTLFSLSLWGSLLAQDRHEQNAGESSSTSLHERGTDAPWFGSSRRSSSDRRRTRMKLDKRRQKQAERLCCVCARQSTKQEKHKKNKIPEAQNEGKL